MCAIPRSITVMNPKVNQTVVATTNLVIKCITGGSVQRVKIEASNGLGDRGHGHGHATRLEI